MSQTEPEFVENHENVLKSLTGYYLFTRNLPAKVLKYCFACISSDQVIADPNVEDELIHKTVLFNKGYIASSSNHAEGFHHHLKVIAKLNLGIEHNIEMLIEQINKKYDKYRSGESGQKVCERIKNELLERQNKYHIKPIDECECGSTFHKEMMLDCEIPCIHTKTKDTKITIDLPQLNEKNFLNVTDFKQMKSPLTGLLKFTNKDIDISDDDENMTLEQITEAIERKREFMSFYNPTLFDENIEDVIRDLTHEELKLGLSEDHVDDFIKFNIGRYFALFKIK